MKVVLIKDILPANFVEVHNDAFKGFFLTSLGNKFLKTYYNAVLKSNLGVIICIIDQENKVQGFAVGSIISKGFHKKLLLQNIISFGFSLFISLILKPGSIIRLFKNLSKQENTVNDDGNYAELLSIAVPSIYKGKGYGKQLLNKFEEVIKERGAKRTTLTTDFYNNKDVLAFYKNLNYSEYYAFTAYPNRKMFKLIKEL